MLLEFIFMLIDFEMPMVVGSLTFVGTVIFRLGLVEGGQGYIVFIMLINVKMSTVVEVVGSNLATGKIFTASIS